jgi:hypothetical protein
VESAESRPNNSEKVEATAAYKLNRKEEVWQLTDELTKNGTGVGGPTISHLTRVKGSL